MEDLFSKIAETRIKEALEKGELDNLPGQGKPLDLKNPNPFETPEERMHNKILQNLGLAPEEVELLKEIDNLKAAIAETIDESIKASMEKKLQENTTRYNIIMERRKNQFN